jgi:hypothetical protein
MKNSVTIVKYHRTIVLCLSRVSFHYLLCVALYREQVRPNEEIMTGFGKQVATIDLINGVDHLNLDWERGI